VINRNIIENAKKATDAWGRLDKKDQGNLKKYFHLRPTQSGISVISTLSFLPMRGLVVPPNKLSVSLDYLKDNYKTITQVDEKKARDFLTDINKKFWFKSRSGISILEENIQSIMINTMSEDSNLSLSLNLSNPIQFIASELRFQQGQYRVDIVGYDKDDLYLFELKRNRTTKVIQLNNYVNYYIKYRTFLEDLLQNYPINPVRKFNNIYGCMVMKYCEEKNQRDKLKNEASANKLKLLFYNSSIRYHK